MTLYAGEVKPRTRLGRLDAIATRFRERQVREQLADQIHKRARQWPTAHQPTPSADRYAEIAVELIRKAVDLR